MYPFVMERRNPRVLAALAVTGAMLLVPASVQASGIVLGPKTIPSTVGSAFGCTGCGSRTWAQLISPGVIEEAPATGLITSWRVAGGEGLRLRVLAPGPGDEEFVGAGTSNPAAHDNGEANATSLPIRAGDLIGADLPEDGHIGVQKLAPDSAVALGFQPALADGLPGKALELEFEDELLLNAEEVFAPVVSSVSPSSGAAAGGNGVKISGQFFDEATSVMFGSVPASSFSVDFEGQITAIAPASSQSAVEIRVTGPGGASEVGPAIAGDRYTYLAPAAGATTPANSPTGSVGASLARLTISSFAQSVARWKRGGSLAQVSKAGPPVGATFSFAINEPASASLVFTQRVQGRRVKGKCVAAGHANAGRPACRRGVTAGSLPVAAHAGLDKVRFQGRLSRAKTLKPGSYGVTIVARDSRGQQALSQGLSFTIVPG
jgi:IPT/TIG domain